MTYASLDSVLESDDDCMNSQEDYNIDSVPILPSLISPLSTTTLTRPAMTTGVVGSSRLQSPVLFPSAYTARRQTANVLL